MGDIWKDNWDETKQHFTDWWKRKGMVMTTSMWQSKFERAKPWQEIPDPGPAASREAYIMDIDHIPLRERYNLSRYEYPLDNFPRTCASLGPGSIGTFLGAEPQVAPDTVWYKPCIEEPDSYPPLKFDPENKWWKFTEELTKRLVASADGNFLVGFPDLIENLDVVAALRDTQKVMFDLIERPTWVKDRIVEVNEVFFSAFDRLYALTKGEDGSSVFDPFEIWAPGKVAKVQCDACAMISPEMFDEFVFPSLKKQCEWLDYSMFHLDGTQCIIHLDSLLKIDALDAIEWTPQAGKPTGSDPMWWDMYKKILDGGKSLQIIGAMKREVPEMVKALGTTKGLYIEMADLGSRTEAEEFRNSIK